MSSTQQISALLVLGRMSYALTATEMTPLAPLKEGMTPQQALDRWLEEETPRVRGAIPIVWEPTGDLAMTHDRLEVPKVARGQFMRLENVASKHVAVTNPAHAWSFEPLPKGVSTGKVYLHVETVPTLQLFGDTAISQGIGISAAWSLASLAFNGFSRGRGAGVKILAVAPGFCGIYTLPSSGQSRGQITVVETSGSDQDQQARQLYHALESADFFAEGAAKTWQLIGDRQDFAELRPLIGSVDPNADAFLENALTGASRLTWPQYITEATKRMPRGGEQDLWASFPQPFPLGTVFRWTAAVAAVVALALAVGLWIAGSDLRDFKARALATNTRLGAELDQATADKTAYEALKAEIAGRDSSNSKGFPRGRDAAMRALSDFVPEDFTITGLQVLSDGALTLDFFQVNDGPELSQELLNMRNELQRVGYANCQVKTLAVQALQDEPPTMATKRHYRLTAQFTP